MGSQSLFDGLAVFFVLPWVAPSERPDNNTGAMRASIHRSKRELLVCPFECDQIKTLCGNFTSSPTASVSFCRCDVCDCGQDDGHEDTMIVLPRNL